jgi:inward rectifier potassium channel
MVNKRDSILLNTHVDAILIMDQGGQEGRFNKIYHRLELELNHVNFFPLTWTIVHPITENSPFHGLSIKALQERNAEVLILVEAFDETHSQTIIEKKGYGGQEWLEGYKFDRNFKVGENGELELFIKEIDTLLPI